MLSKVAAQEAVGAGSRAKRDRIVAQSRKGGYGVPAIIATTDTLSPGTSYDRTMKKPFTWEREPFQDCPQCNEQGSLGVLSIGENGFTKRCTSCRYSQTELLPALDKKVIYLDQFAFSELHKLRSGQRREDKWTPFWTMVSELLNRALLLQQIVVPYSNVHHDETIVSPFPKALRVTQEHIGGDIRFVDTDEVQLNQIEEYARAFFAGEEPAPSFDVDDVLDGNRNAWLPEMRISVNMDWSSFADSKRLGRTEVHANVSSLIEGWKGSESGFEAVLERELGAYFESRRDAMRHAFQRLERGLAEDDVFAGVNFNHSFVIREMHLVHYLAAEADVPKEGWTRATALLWNWERNREQPQGQMLAYMFAALAAQVKAGRSKLPSAGFMNDIKAISAYAPYVDAMFIDKECATLLNYGRCRDELRYKARIFSYSNADEFMTYIHNIVAGTPEDVRKPAEALYGLT